MATVLEQVEKAINRGDAEQAHELLRDELLSNPTAEAYYLASLVAFDEAQQREFLEKALAIYPFHKKAYVQLETLRTGIVRSSESFPYASISTRFVASLIDGFILMLAAQMPLVLLSSLGVLSQATLFDLYQYDFNQPTDPAATLLTFVIGQIVNVVYNVYFLSYQDGQTPGKRLRKIKIVSLNSDQITPRQALIRSISANWLSALFLIGYLAAIWDPNRQAWHDKLAKTIVIRTTPKR